MRNKLERWTEGTLRLIVLEWQDLLSQSARYEVRSRVLSLPMADLFAPRLESILRHVKHVSTLGLKAQISLARVLGAVLQALRQQDAQALEAALKRLFELGREPSPREAGADHGPLTEA